MTKTVATLMGAIAALVTAAAFAPSYAEKQVNDGAYRRQLIKEYKFVTARGGADVDGLATDVSMDQCWSGNPDPSTLVLQQMLRDKGFQVPPRS
jgi:hypothetical protein